MLKKNDIAVVFSSEEGKRVLHWLLYKLHVYDSKIKTPEALTLRNFGMDLLQTVSPTSSEDSIAHITALLQAGITERRE